MKGLAYNLIWVGVLNPEVKESPHEDSEGYQRVPSESILVSVPRDDHSNIRPALDASSHLDSLEIIELCGGLEAITLQQCSACGARS